MTLDATFFPLQTHGDERGSLVALEDGKNVLFPIRRVYYLYGTKPGVRRGLHAHKTLNQMAIAVRGACMFHLDDGRHTVDFVLNDPARGLLLPPLIWHEMYDFSEDCVLMVLADAHYDESDYIRSHDDFLSLVGAA